MNTAKHPIVRRVSAALAALLAAGCLSSVSPYDYAENWLIREEASRTFVSQADVIYLQDALYDASANPSVMYARARREVGDGRFRGVARIFAPLVATSEDLELALAWYFRHHEDGRAFVFIGAGAGGRLLKAYAERHAEELARVGLAAEFYADETGAGFVTDDVVQAVRAAAARVRYRAIWGRDMSPAAAEGEKPAE